MAFEAGNSPDSSVEATAPAAVSRRSAHVELQAAHGPPQSVPVSPWFLTVSVHVASTQLLLQPSSLTVLPSSHASAPCFTPSPHTTHAAQGPPQSVAVSP